MDIDGFRELTTEEYMVEEKKFFKKYNEYITKLTKLRDEENVIIERDYAGDHSKYLLSDDDCVFEERRSQLRVQYNNFTDPVFTDYFCVITPDNIDMLVLKKDLTYKCIKRDIVSYKDKTVSDGVRTGLFKGVITTPDDFYYVLQTDTGVNVLVPFLSTLTVIK